jgi:hypothetical protein
MTSQDLLCDDEAKSAFKIERIKQLGLSLKNCHSLQEKLDVLDGDSVVSSYLATPSLLRTFLAGLSLECELVVKSVIAIGQAEQVIDGIQISEAGERLRALIADLMPVEEFYQEIGGIVGYQATMLSFLDAVSISLTDSTRISDKQDPPDCVRYHSPTGIDLSTKTFEGRQQVVAGIRFLPLMAEMYPVGGAADRLRLFDPETKIALPAAKLKFIGKTLLERLIADLQAREYLYYKLFKEQIVTPIAMMTSQEKDNHAQILSICCEHRWFGRPADHFVLFCQPLVPTMDREGNWCLIGPCKPLMKPGGHGVIWKVAEAQGVFSWLSSLKRTKLLVRQINNPIAGCDDGLAAFTGLGCREDHFFGFASCLRQVGSAEGINVVIERNRADQIESCLTSIEYCDFHKFGIKDEPIESGSCYAKFPSNTNILFADIKALLEAIKKCSIPGMIVNLKKVSYYDENGELKEREMARLESTMQNIADYFSSRTFLAFNQRRKTISAVKKEFLPNSSLLETPEGCYYDLLCNAHELLSSHCGFSLPDMPSVEEYIHSGAPFHFSYHPALGPSYAIIAQKIRGGTILTGSEWMVEIAELDASDVSLDGSLQIKAECVMGHFDEKGILIYSECVGRCVLKNVIVRNLGIERETPHSYWKNEIVRRESCAIILHGESEFYAEDVVLEGDLQIDVEDGFRIIAKMEEEKLVFLREKLEPIKSFWNYTLQEDHSIFLESLPNEKAANK